MSVVDTPRLPIGFRSIRLERAREPDHPDGDDRIGYTLLAPLTAAGHLDAQLAKSHQEFCKVVRFQLGQPGKVGYLRRRPDGSWAIHYQSAAGGDDDPGVKFDEHRFVAGDYVTINEDDAAHTYRIVWVRPV